MPVHHAPCVEYIAHDKGDEQTHPCHRAEGEFAAARIGNGERRLEVCIGRIEAGVVETRIQQQGQDREHHTDAYRPDATDIVFPKHCFCYVRYNF